MIDMGRVKEGKPDQSKTSNTQASQCSRQESSVSMDLVDDGLGYKRIDRRYKEKLNEIGVRQT